MRLAIIVTSPSSIFLSESFHHILSLKRLFPPPQSEMFRSLLQEGGAPRTAACLCTLHCVEHSLQEAAPPFAAAAAAASVPLPGAAAAAAGSRDAAVSNGHDPAAAAGPAGSSAPSSARSGLISGGRAGPAIGHSLRERLARTVKSTVNTAVASMLSSAMAAEAASAAQEQAARPDAVLSKHAGANCVNKRHERSFLLCYIPCHGHCSVALLIIRCQVLLSGFKTDAGCWKA